VENTFVLFSLIYHSVSSGSSPGRKNATSTAVLIATGPPPAADAYMYSLAVRRTRNADGGLAPGAADSQRRRESKLDGQRAGAGWQRRSGCAGWLGDGWLRERREQLCGEQRYRDFAALARASPTWGHAL
jgi:hypothetical protein